MAILSGVSLGMFKSDVVDVSMVYAVILSRKKRSAK